MNLGSGSRAVITARLVPYRNREKGVSLRLTFKMRDSFNFVLALEFLFCRRAISIPTRLD